MESVFVFCGVMNVEKLVSAILDDLLVNRVYNGIFLRAANAEHSVRFIKSLASCFLGVAEVGLTAAVYTAAGASHDLNEGPICFARSDLLHYLVSGVRTACNCNLNVKTCNIY